MTPTGSAVAERPAAASPRHDRDFIDRCLTDLLQHWGAYRQLGRLYAAHVPSFERCLVVREAVEWGRRLGFDIEGDRGRGYRVVGFAHPAAVYMIRPGPHAHTEHEESDPRQLTLMELLAVD